MFSNDIVNLSTDVLEKARQKSFKIATAESCTGGLISAALTEIAGSSDVFDRGFATYSNDAKMDMLDVSADMLDTYGAVSEQVAQAMAQGAVKNSLANIAVTTTGIAGPTGATDGKPVGLVYFGLHIKNGVTIYDKKVFDGNRSDVREQSVLHALKLLTSNL